MRNTFHRFVVSDKEKACVVIVNYVVVQPLEGLALGRRCPFREQFLRKEASKAINYSTSTLLLKSRSGLPRL